MGIGLLVGWVLDHLVTAAQSHHATLTASHALDVECVADARRDHPSAHRRSATPNADRYAVCLRADAREGAVQLR